MYSQKRTENNSLLECQWSCQFGPTKTLLVRPDKRTYLCRSLRDPLQMCNSYSKPAWVQPLTHCLSNLTEISNHGWTCSQRTRSCNLQAFCSTWGRTSGLEGSSVSTNFWLLNLSLEARYDPTLEMCWLRSFSPASLHTKVKRLCF